MKIYIYHTEKSFKGEKFRKLVKKKWDFGGLLASIILYCLLSIEPSNKFEENFADRQKKQ